MNYQHKYLKYKEKYLLLLNKNQYGGDIFNDMKNDILNKYNGLELFKFNIRLNFPDLKKYIDFNETQTDISQQQISKHFSSTDVFDISHQQIIKNCLLDSYIRNNLDKFIIGLHHVVKLTKDDKIIYLLGEIHSEKSSIFKSSDDITEGDFIQNILKYSPLFIDFFIEQDIMHKTQRGKNTDSDIEYMRDSKRFQADLFKMSLISCTDFHNVRCHFVDPRTCIFNADNKIKGRECNIGPEKITCSDTDTNKCKLYELLQKILPLYGEKIYYDVNDEDFYKNIVEYIKIAIPSISKYSEITEDNKQITEYDKELIHNEIKNFLKKFYLGDLIEELEYSKLIKKALTKNNKDIKDNILKFIDNFLYNELNKDIQYILDSRSIEFILNNICFKIFYYSINYTLDVYLILRLFKNMNTSKTE
jgi:hypothetical protein